MLPVVYMTFIKIQQFSFCPRSDLLLRVSLSCSRVQINCNVNKKNKRKGKTSSVGRIFFLLDQSVMVRLSEELHLFVFSKQLCF